MRKLKNQAKEPVRLREKTLSDGRRSLYLDIYYRGRRRYEFLKLHFVPELTPEDREQNRQTRIIAERKKAERIVALQNLDAEYRERELMSEMSLTRWLAIEESQSSEKLSDSTVALRKRVHTIVNQYLMSISRPDLAMFEIDKTFCRGFIAYLRTVTNALTNDSRPISQNTQQNYQKTFIASINHAVREGYMNRNPFDEIPVSERIVKKDSTREFLTIEETKRLLSTPCRREDVRQAFMFAIFTGLRISDVRLLCPRHIKQSPDAKSEYIDIEMKKTGDHVVVPLAQEARLFLPEPIDDDTPFFTLPTNATVSYTIREWMQAAEIDKHITFHSSRHTFATTLLTLGADLYVTSKLLGHRNIQTTEIYAKVVDEKKIESVYLLDDMFLGKDT